MFNVRRRAALLTSAAGLVAASFAKWHGPAKAATSYGPDDLKSTLTPFGGIRAGNADGTIPAWTGGYSTVPAGYKQGDPRPIPFTDEQPLFTITAQNYTKYQDKLSPGLIGMFQKYPDFEMEVYPTHRTAIAPQYVYDYMYKNASNAKTSADGNAITGAYGGIPFPIPKTGHEIMWNHELGWCGTTAFFVSDAHAVTNAGQVVLETRASVWFQYPYYFENGESQFQGFFADHFILPTAPPYEAGGSILQFVTVNPIVTPVEAWIYLIGQRRTRRAPELQYDTPNSLSGGIQNWDEDQIFFGKMDRYDFNYTGDKEMYVPYNTNKAFAVSLTKQFGPHFINPQIVRWELHRVRVVDAKLKPGQRNVDTTRRFYADEDTGWIVMGEVYDAAGSLFKHNHTFPAIFPDVPCVHSQQNNVTYDLHAGNYFWGDHYDAECQPQWKIIDRLPSSFFTPGQLAASAGGY